MKYCLNPLARILRLPLFSTGIICLTLSAAHSQSETITFDELPPLTTPVDDLNVKGVTFDSAGATFNAVGLAGQTFTDTAVLEGDAAGILTIDFDKLVSAFSFGVNLNSAAMAATPGLTVDLFGLNLVPLGTIPLAMNSVGSAFLEGQFMYPGGPPVGFASIDFNEGAAGMPTLFQIDNLSYDLYVPPVVEPTPRRAPPVQAPRRAPTPVPQPFLLVDFEAIAAASTSGLALPAAHQGILQSVNQPAIRDLNSRLFRARTRRPAETPGTARGASLTRYLNLTNDLNIDSRVALGMREGQQVEVSGNLPATHLFTMTGWQIPIAAGASTTYTAAAPEGEISEPGSSIPSNESGKGTVRSCWEVFSSVDYGNNDLEDLSATFSGYQTDTYSATAGAEYTVNDWLTAGFAFSQLDSQSKLSANLGSVDIEGQLYSTYITAFKNGYYADFLFSYGDYDSHLTRNPRFGSNTIGDPESSGQTYALNLGKNFAPTDQIVTGPILAADYNLGEIDSYIERGNQRANLIYDDADYDSLVTRLGWQVGHYTKVGQTGIHSQFRLAWEKEHLPEDGQISATLEQSPFLLVTPGVGSERIGGFSASDDQSHAGTDWLAFGSGVRFEFPNQVNLLFDYEGHYFQNNQLTQFVSVKLSYKF